MTRFCASLPERALGAAAALAAISLSPSSAQAFVVTVGGAQYDVSTEVDPAVRSAAPPVPVRGG